jgi:hypothetical protein
MPSSLIAYISTKASVKFQPSSFQIEDALAHQDQWVSFSFPLSCFIISLLMSSGTGDDPTQVFRAYRISCNAVMGHY